MFTIYEQNNKNCSLAINFLYDILNSRKRGTAMHKCRLCSLKEVVPMKDDVPIPLPKETIEQDSIELEILFCYLCRTNALELFAPEKEDLFFSILLTK